MTTVIDERVVEMRFNNEDFEKNVRESMNTLDKLKQSLNFDSANSLKDLGNVAKGFSLNSVSESVKTVTSSFSALETVGIGALMNIGAKAADVGARVVKSLSVDQISEGFQKYADKTTAVQTIIAATGKSLQTVEGELEKLNWFTDETSYNFVDMVNNIGKFTSNGVELEKASSAMQGIASWAARSGQNAAAASRVMYNFSQALGSGAMMVKDWMSIENANMATKEFKQTAIETAVELGRLKKAGEGLYTTLDGETTVSVKEFRDSLKDKWFDEKVMIETLNRYNSFADELYELSDKTGRSATQLMMDADKFAEGALDIQKIADSSGVSVKELTDAYTSLNAESNKLSRQAFENAQEAKTFADAINATKDAVSTGWMNTFQLIFGDYNEAKALWTGLANSLVELFTVVGTARNEILQFWHTFEGRTALIGGLVSMLNLIIKPLSVIKQAFDDVMPSTEAIGKGLADASKGFESFMDKLQPSKEFLGGLYTIFKGLFTIIREVGGVFGKLFGITSKFSGGFFTNVVQGIGTFVTYVAAAISIISDYAEELGIFEAVSTTIGEVFRTIGDAVDKFFSSFGGDLLSGLVGMIAFIIISLGNAASSIKRFVTSSNILQSIIVKVSGAFTSLSKAISSFFKPAEKATTVVKKATTYYGEAAAVTAEFGTLTRDAGNDIEQTVTPLSKVAKAFKTVGTVIVGIGAMAISTLKKFTKGINDFFTANNAGVDKAVTNVAGFKTAQKAPSLLSVAFDALGKIFDSLKEKINSVFTPVSDGASQAEKSIYAVSSAIQTFITNLDGGRVAAIAMSIGMIAIIRSSAKLAKQIGNSVETVANSTKNFVESFAGIGRSVTNMFNTVSQAVKTMTTRNMVTTTIKDLAKAFAMVALSLAALSLVDTNKLLIASGVMGGFIVVFSVLTGVVITLSKKLNNAKFQLNFRQMAKSIILLASSMAILGLSVSILAGTKIEGSIPELFAKIGSAVALLAAVVGAAIALSKFSKDLPKGAILLLAMAFAMKQLALSVKEFASIEVDNINDHWGTYFAMFGGLSLIMAAAGHVKVSSALALLALAKAMKVILPAMGEIVELAKNLPYERMCQAATDNIVAIVGTLGMLSIAVMTIIKLIQTIKGKTDKVKGGKSGLFSGIGGTIAGIGLGVTLLVYSIKRLHELTKEFKEGEALEIVGMLAGIMFVLGAIVAIITALNNITGGIGVDSSKNFAKIGVMMVALAVAVRIMAAAVGALSKLDDQGAAWSAVGMITVLGLVMATVVGVSGTVQKAIPAMAALMTAVFAMGFIIGELALLSLIVDAPGMNKALWIMAGIFVALNVTMRSMEKIKDIKMGPVLLLIGTIVAAMGALIYLSTLDTMAVLGSAAAMSMVFLSLGNLMKIINSIQQISVKKILSLLGVTVALLPLAGALYLLSTQPWEGIIAAGGGMMLAMYAVAFVMDTLDDIKVIGVKKIGALLGVAIAMIPMAFALTILATQPWDSILASAGAMAISLVAISGALLILDKFGSSGGQLAAALSILTVALALIPVAYAVQQLAHIELGDAAGKVAALLGIMSGFVLIFGLISGIPGFGQGFALGMVAFAGSILLLAAALNVIATSLPLLALGISALTPTLIQLATVDLTSLGSGLLVFAVGLGAVGLAGALVGVGGIGLMILANALQYLGVIAPVAAAGLTQLQNVDLVGIALGLGAIGLAGALVGALSPLLIVAAAGVGIFAASLYLLKGGFDAVSGLFEGFNAALGSVSDGIAQKIESIKTTIKGLFPDLTSAFNTEGAGVIAAASALGANIAGGKHPDTGFIGGLASVLGWHSNPDVIEELMTDVGSAFSDNGTAVSAASASGTDIGDSFGKNLASKVSQWLSSVGSGIGSFFNSLGNGTPVVASVGSELGSAGAQAEKFNKTTGETNKEMGLLEKGINKVKEKAKEFTEPLEETVGLLKEDFLPDTDKLTEEMEKATGAAGGLSDGLDGVGKSAGKASKSVKDFNTSLKDTIEGQLDMFSKFEIKTEMSSQTVIDNMKSNIDGFASWSHRMAVLSQRFADAGIDKSLYEKLAEMGPKGYETMNAFYNMSEEQLAEVKDLWATGLTLPQSQADIVGAGYKYMGEMAVQGFSNALDDHNKAHEAIHGFTKDVVDTGKEDLGIASPSTVFFNMAYNCVLGFWSGTIENIHWGRDAINFLVKTVLDIADVNFNIEKFSAYGKNIVEGLAIGMEDEDMLARLRAATQTILEMVNETIEKKEEIKSPSRVTMAYGRYITQGVAVGMLDAATNVRDAASKVMDAANTGFTAEGRIQDALDFGLDYNPIITPMLDLSLVRSQMADINSMFASGRIGVNAQNGGQFSSKPSETNVTFTQNNYSPKALSRIDIYRQTKNQISMMKGAVANA